MPLCTPRSIFGPDIDPRLAVRNDPASGGTLNTSSDMPAEDEETPLLGQAGEDDGDDVEIPSSSIFLKTTEGICLPTIVLFYVRFVLFLAMTTLFIMHFVYQLILGHGVIFFFLLGNLTWLGQIIYQGFAWYWTHRAASSAWISPAPPDDDPANFSPVVLRARGYILRLIIFPSLTMVESLFSSFYVSTVTLPPVATFLYLYVLRIPADAFGGPSTEPVADTLIPITHTANTAICLIEILFLNSIVYQSSFWYDLIVLSVGTLGYCQVWAVLGTKLADSNVEDGWLDPGFFGGGERGRKLTPELVMGAVVVVLCFWFAQWLLHMAKGWMLRATRQDVSEPRYPSPFLENPV